MMKPRGRQSDKLYTARLEKGYCGLTIRAQRNPSYFVSISGSYRTWECGFVTVLVRPKIPSSLTPLRSNRAWADLMTWRRPWHAEKVIYCRSRSGNDGPFARNCAKAFR